jgi:RimJ/RimL family protein N-acetyltransferase
LPQYFQDWPTAHGHSVDAPPGAVGGDVKLEALKDGTAVEIREPTMDDLPRSIAFFRDLPPEDRRYLRIDVTKPDLVEKRIRQSLEGHVFRLVALDGDQIVADGSLAISSEGWRKHQGEIRVIVARKYQRKRLGALMIQEVFRAARDRDVEKVIAKMAGPQIAARKVFERLGFRLDATLPDYVKDADGTLHPLIVMTCTFDDFSEEMRDFYKRGNWPDG